MNSKTFNEIIATLQTMKRGDLVKQFGQAVVTASGKTWADYDMEMQHRFMSDVAAEVNKALSKYLKAEVTRAGKSSIAVTFDGVTVSDMPIEGMILVWAEGEGNVKISVSANVSGHKALDEDKIIHRDTATGAAIAKILINFIRPL